jgi:CxxC-x17-CxxC domain-containing protein
VAYADRTLTCAECGSEFTFTADDQEFHAKKGYQDPKRCPNCRAARRAGGGGGGYGGGSYGGGGGGGYSRAPRQMYTATCDNCGNEAQLPFQPRQDRPVYCSDCFNKVRPARSGGW